MGTVALGVPGPGRWVPDAAAHGLAPTQAPDATATTETTAVPAGAPVDERAAVDHTIDVLRADAEQVRAALDDTEARRGAAQLQLADARAAAAAAADALAAAEMAERAAAERAARLDDEVRAAIVDAYVGAGRDVPLRVLVSNDTDDAAWQATVLRSRAEERRKLLVKQQRAHREVAAERRTRAAKATEAEAAEGRASRVVDELIALENSQATLVAQVDDRLDAALSEAAALAAIDQEAAAALALREQALATAAAQSLVAPLPQASPAAPAPSGRPATRATPVTAPPSTSSTLPPAPAPPSTAPSPPTTVPSGPVQPPVPVDTVNVGGLVVARSIADQVANLLAAAQGAGLTLGGSAYRDVASQIALRRLHCGPTDYDIWQKPASQCSPATAIPGRSMHEKGLALDLTCAGLLIRDRANACFVWLAANAATFGFYNLPSEPWHWSTNGN